MGYLVDVLRFGRHRLANLRPDCDDVALRMRKCAPHGEAAAAEQAWLCGVPETYKDVHLKTQSVNPKQEIYDCYRDCYSGCRYPDLRRVGVGERFYRQQPQPLLCRVGGHLAVHYAPDRDDCDAGALQTRQ